MTSTEKSISKLDRSIHDEALFMRLDGPCVIRWLSRMQERGWCGHVALSRNWRLWLPICGMEYIRNSDKFDRLSTIEKTTMYCLKWTKFRGRGAILPLIGDKYVESNSGPGLEQVIWVHLGMNSWDGDVVFWYSNNFLSAVWLNIPHGTLQVEGLDQKHDRTELSDPCHID